METMIFNSPKKYRIIAIKDYLIKNNIPISSIKLCLLLNRGAMVKRDDIDMPIEDFNEKLNNSQVFEIYIDEADEENASKLFVDFDVETFFNDCVYKSDNYDEAFEINQLLNKNNLRCDDVFTVTDVETDTEEYLLFIDPEEKDDALKIINEFKKVETHKPQNIKFEDNFTREEDTGNSLRYIIPIIIVVLLLLFFIKIDDVSILKIIINKIAYYASPFKNSLTA